MKSSTGSEVSSQSVLFTARRKQNLILKAPNTVCGKAFLQVDVQNKSKGVFFPFMPYQNLNVLSGLYLKHSCHIKASHLMLDHLSDGCLSRLQCSCKVPSLSDVITFSHHSKTQQLNVSCDAGLGKLARLFIEMLQVISWLITTKISQCYQVFYSFKIYFALVRTLSQNWTFGVQGQHFKKSMAFGVSSWLNVINAEKQSQQSPLYMYLVSDKVS